MRTAMTAVPRELLALSGRIAISDLPTNRELAHEPKLQTLTRSLSQISKPVLLVFGMLRRASFLRALLFGVPLPVVSAGESPTAGKPAPLLPLEGFDDGHGYGELIALT